MSSSDYYSVQVGYPIFVIDKRYVQLKAVGDGSYGFVASALDTVTGNKVAIKKIANVFSDLVDAKRILREIKLLRHFNSHENIINIVDVMTNPPNTLDFQDIYIVTYLMESDLERIIHSKQKLTDQHFQYFLYQILRGLKYIHSANVLHRDLKPSNLLVNGNCDLAVCDFGLARGFDSEGDTMTEYVVTRWYRAPELLCECPHYGKAVDIWSVGCIFAEIITHDPIFQGKDPQHQLEIIVSKLGCPRRDQLDFVMNDSGMASFVVTPHATLALARILRYEHARHPPFQTLFPNGCNPLALDLLHRMLRIVPEDRISVEDALRHPYLKDFQGQLPEPSSPQLFDFDFEKCADMVEGLSQIEVAALMYMELLNFRPQADASVLRDVVLPNGQLRRNSGYGDDDAEMKTAREYDYAADSAEYKQSKDSHKGYNDGMMSVASCCSEK